MDDEQIQAVTVGEVPTYQDIVLVEYDPQWPTLFGEAAEQIRGALGDAALQIDHVGSTSVPGLMAKPLIDINLVVADTTAEEAYVPKLEAVGYVLAARERIDRELYARTKRELCAKEWKYVQNYADAKTAVVEEILAGARAAAR